MQAIFELWSTLPPLPGALRQRRLSPVLSAALSESMAAPASLTLTLPVEAADGVRKRRAIVMTEPDGRVTDWVIHTVTRSPLSPVVSVACHDPLLLLQERRPARQAGVGEYPDEYSFSGTKLLSEWIASAIVLEPFLTQDGLPCFVLGTVEDDLVLTLEDTPRQSRLAFFLDLARRSALEPVVERVVDGATIQYALSLVKSRGSSLPVLPLRFGNEIASMTETDTAEGLAAIVEPVAEGGAFDISTALWSVVSTAPDGTGHLVALADPSGSDGPIAEDGQCVGTYLMCGESGRAVPVVASLAASSAVKTTAVAVGGRASQTSNANLVPYSNDLSHPLFFVPSSAALLCEYVETAGGINYRKIGGSTTGAFYEHIVGNALSTTVAYTLSVYFKKDTSTQTKLGVYSNSASAWVARARIDWSGTPSITSEVGSGATLESLGGDRYRAVVPIPPGGTGGNRVRIEANTATASQTVLCGGIQVAVGTEAGAFIDTAPWGAYNTITSSEDGSAPSVSGAGISRAADPEMHAPGIAGRVIKVSKTAGSAATGHVAWTAVAASTLSGLYTTSIYLKASPDIALRRTIRVLLFSSADVQRADINTADASWSVTNTLGSGHALTPVGDGWWRLSMRSSLTAVAHSIRIHPLASGTDAAEVLVAGPSLTAREDVPPYSPTGASASVGGYTQVTRRPDLAVGGYARFVANAQRQRLTTLSLPSLLAELGPVAAAMSVAGARGETNLAVNGGLSLVPDSANWIPRPFADVLGQVDGDQASGSTPLVVKGFPANQRIVAGEPYYIYGVSATASASAAIAGDGTATVSISPVLAAAIGGDVEMTVQWPSLSVKCRTSGAQSAGSSSLVLKDLPPPPALLAGDTVVLRYTGTIYRYSAEAFPSFTISAGQWVIVNLNEACLANEVMPSSYSGSLSFIGYEGGDRTKPRFYCNAGTATINLGQPFVDYGTESKTVSIVSPPSFNHSTGSWGALTVDEAFGTIGKYPDNALEVAWQQKPQRSGGDVTWGSPYIASRPVWLRLGGAVADTVLAVFGLDDYTGIKAGQVFRVAGQLVTASATVTLDGAGAGSIGGARSAAAINNAQVALLRPPLPPTTPGGVRAVIAAAQAAWETPAITRDTVDVPVSWHIGFAMWIPSLSGTASANVTISAELADADTGAVLDTIATVPSPITVSRGDPMYLELRKTYTLTQTRRVRLRLIGGTNVYVYPLWGMVTIGDDLTLPFFEGSYANVIWQRANRGLLAMAGAGRRIRIGLREYTANIVPRLGQQVFLEEYGLTQRVMEMQFDPVTRRLSSLTLASVVDRATRYLALTR